MSAAPDHELLGRYTREGSEEAFRELVGRHMDLVYSVALRVVNGDRQLAEDVAQRIFTEVARRADRLAVRPTLAGWLHVSARNAAIDLVRREHRRHEREQEACIMNETQTAPDVNWELLRPVLDEAVAWLKESDRDAVVLRFFQGKSHREIGEALGLNENTARMRVDRALDKLRTYFARRGVTVSSALLALAISTNAVQAAPANLAAAVAGKTLAGVGAAAASGSFLKALSTATKVKLAAVAAVALATVTAATVYQQTQITRLNGELAVVRESQAVAARNYALHTSFSYRLSGLLAIAGEHGRTALETTRELAPLLVDLNAADASRLLDALAKLPATDASVAAKSALLEIWAGSSPAAALQWARARANDPHRGDYLLAVLTTWSNQDPMGAWTAASQVDDAAARQNIQMTLLARFADKDPPGALDALLKLPVSQRSKTLFAALFQSWTEKNAPAAASAALQLPASVVRETAITVVAAAWGRQDAGAALAWANNLPADNSRATAVDEVIKALGASDPQAATQYLGNLPAGSQCDKLTADLAASWAATDVQAALAWAEGLGAGQAHDKAIEAILAQMSQTNPAAAAAYLETVTQPYIRAVALPQLAKVWAQSDIQAALAWVQALPVADGSARSAACQNVLDTWIQSDPVNAAAYVQSLASDPNFPDIATQVAKNWAATDPQAAVTWTESLPAGAIRNTALLSALTAYADYDPQSAWSTAIALPDDEYGDNRLRFLSSIASIWSDTDPAQAAQLLTALPSHNTQGVSAAMGVTAANWLKQDPAAALQWIESLPPSGARDRAMAQVIAIEGKNDLATAFAWARSLNPAGPVRNKGAIVDDIVIEWAKKDPAAAAAAITADGAMNNARRTELLNMVRQNSPNLPANVAAASLAGVSAP